MYPVLAALGIWFGVTPALAGEVCRQVSDSDSVRTGRSALARRGIVIGHERPLRIVNLTSQRAVAQRQRWLHAVRDADTRPGPLAGKRVVVAIDGGRLRERVAARSGRRRKKNRASPRDIRRQMNRLSAMVRAEMQLDPESGELYVFRNRPRDMIKVLFYVRSTRLLSSL